MGRETMTIPSALTRFRASRALTPGMHGIVLRLADEVDHLRLRSDVTDAVWLELRTADLRVGGRSDNHWLRQWLTDLTGVRLSGERKGDPWGAVLVAEWHIERGGRLVRVLMPPAAVNALRWPETFAKVETECMFRLRGASRELYLVLAGKKRLKQNFWQFELPELRAILGVGERKAYERWNAFVKRVLEPAVAAINDLGTVNVTMTPIRDGRSISAVRFDWRWKTLDELQVAAEEVDRHSVARGEPRDGEPEAPPLVVRAAVSPDERQKGVAMLRDFVAERETRGRGER